MHHPAKLWLIATAPHTQYPPPIQLKPVNPCQVWLRGVPVQWLVLLAMAPLTLMLGCWRACFTTWSASYGNSTP